MIDIFISSCKKVSMGLITPPEVFLTYEKFSKHSQYSRFFMKNQVLDIRSVVTRFVMVSTGRNEPKPK